MSLLTPNYNLTAFTWGETYSASIDKERFSIIDNQMAFYSDLIGSGRIEGWEVSINDLNNRELSVSKGSGLIDIFITNTFGPLNFSLQNNKITNLFMKRKEDILGGFSSFSNMDEISYEDTINPNNPLNVDASSSSAYEVDLSWDANTDIDLDYYEILRSTDDITFNSIGTTEDIFYNDNTVGQDDIYYYKVNAVDVNENSSNNTSVMVSVPKDLTPPLNPLFFQAFAGDGLIQCVWDFSVSTNVKSEDGYRISATPLDINYNVNGSEIIYFVDSDVSYITIKNLKNNIPYKITINTVSFNDVLSEGLSLVRVPEESNQKGEVSDVSITYGEGVNDDFNINMDISWDFNLDPYFVNPDRFIITVIENGAKESEPIIVLGEDSRNLSLKVLPFRNELNEIIYESVKEVTQYTIIIQTSDEDENTSNGIIVRSTSPSFKKPLPVTNLVMTRNEDNSMLVSWDNTTSNYFAYNLVNLKIVFLNNPSLSEQYILQDENIGKANTYIIDKKYFQQDIRYEFEIVAVDDFNNESIEALVLFNTIEDVVSERPDVPDSQNISSEEDGILISWELMDINQIKQYKIWRSVFKRFMSASDFILLDTVSSTQSSYKDFDTTVGTRYVYFVTAVSIFGEESLNPVDDDYTSYPLLIGSPKETSDFIPPENLSVVSSGANDVTLTWDATAGSFDGYEIFRSFNNKYSFKRIGATIPSRTTFTDFDALVEDGVYYYLVRKFKNEGEIFLTESSSIPSDSIFLAEIKTYTSGGSQAIEIDDSDVRDIKDLKDPITDVAKERINAHNHKFEIIDKRIDLDSDIKVDLWYTSDFQSYKTTFNIEGAQQYIVSVEGQVNENYFKDEDGSINSISLARANNGVSPFLYSVNPSNQSIIFAKPLYSELEEKNTPYESPPSISLEMIGVSETTESLSNSRLESLSANQVISGELDTRQIKGLSHEGRIGEALIPVPVPMTSFDNYVYIFAEENDDPDKNKMGTATTFYDIIGVKGTDTELVAATSKGVLYSQDNGLKWQKKLSTPTAVFKMFYSNYLKQYFAVSSQGVYYKRGDGFSSWVLMKGTEQVKVIRDIVEDASGSLYISTDLGVYKLKQENALNFFEWEQLSIFGPRSSEAYALLYDEDKNRILVSNELGILESFNEGGSWNFTSEFTEQKKIYKFLQKNNYIFALTNNEVWRKIDNEDFEKIADLDSDIARDMAIFNNIIYITTNNGILASQSFENIFTDINVSITNVFPSLNINNNIIPITSVSIINDLLFLGMDRKVAIYNNEEIWIQFEELNSTIPTVFLNEETYRLGFYYNNSDDNFNNLSFDERLPFDSIVEVANKYNEYRTPNNGWAKQRATSKIILKYNFNTIGETSDIIIDKTPFVNFVFPEYTDINSNFLTANSLENETQQLIDDFLNLPLDASNKEVNDAIASILKSIEAFSSQLYKEAKFINGDPFTLPVLEVGLRDNTGETDENGNIIFEELENNINVDITNGIFYFEENFDKYDNLNVDIIGAGFENIGELTHKELENNFELANSGLPSSLSQIYHSNLLKLGIYIDKKFPNETEEFVTNKQIKYIIPRNKDFYDSLNSTIDYQEEINKDNYIFTLPYPTTVFFIPNINKVFIGGNGGALSIDINNLEMKEIQISNLQSPFVKKIILDKNIIYLLTDFNIYISEDFGLNWDIINRTGLSSNLNTFTIFKNIFIVGADDGIYYKSFFQNKWEKAIESSVPVELLISPDLVFTVVDNNVYTTGDGINFNKIDHKNIGKITSIIKHRNSIYLGTTQGLYTDSSSFYGINASLSLVNLADNRSDSSELVINSLKSNGENLFIGLNNGNYYKLEEDIFILEENTLLETIHNIEIVNNDEWLFGYDLLKIPRLNIPIKLTTGAPL